MKKISIYTPCYNEESNVELCYKAIKELMENQLPTYDYEHIFGDNCSDDGTLRILRGIAEKDKKVKVIAYSRNFGAFNSYFNGLLSSTGDGIIPFFPADLQEPPEVIVEMVEFWQDGFEVVYGKKIGREEGFIMKSLREIYYKIVSKTAAIEIPRNVGEFALVDKKIQNALRQFDDYYPYLRGMIASCGFKCAYVDYVWRKRKHGKSSGNFLILLDNAINGIISFSNVPMRLCMIFGVFLSGISLAYSVYSFVSSVIFYHQLTVPGIPLLITAVFFFFGIILFFIGVLGEYISAIHFQVRKRPLVIEAERINF